MTTLYVETSALLRVLLEGDDELAGAIAAAERHLTSSLTAVEAQRAIRRARQEKRIDAAAQRELERRIRSFERAADVLAMDDEVLVRAREDYPIEPVRTLDAIHLASVRVWADEVGGLAVASCDDRVRENARELGFDLVPEEP